MNNFLRTRERRKMQRSPGSMRSILRWVAISVMTCLFFTAWEPNISRGSDTLTVPGITEPIRDITLSSTDMGTVTAIHFREGMAVIKGETLMELDNQLETFEVDRRMLIWKSKAEVHAGGIKVATLKTMLTSTRELFKETGAVSKEELDKITLEYELAVADRKRLEINEERERIEYEMANENLRKRRFVSPIIGTVIKLYLEEGESCRENQPLVQVVDTSRCLFVCNVEEWVGRTLEKGQTARLTIKAGNSTIAKTGRFVFVSPVVDPASGLLEVKVEFDNTDGSVRPGISGSLLLDKVPGG